MDFISSINPGQWVILSTILIGFATAYFKFRPEQTRAETEGKISAAAELADRFKAWRQEVHEMNNKLQIVAANQAKCDKALSAATTLNEQLMFLIELMIVELETLDPNSKTVQRARTMFKRLSSATGSDPKKSDALNTAEMAVQDAKQTLVSTKETCEEVKSSEKKDGSGK